MKSNTKEFWQQVQKEYEELFYMVYLCQASRTFKSAWIDEEYNIKIHAKNFLKNNERYNDKGVGYACLFIPRTSSKIRIDFIQYCIDNLK